MELSTDIFLSEILVDSGTNFNGEIYSGRHKLILGYWAQCLYSALTHCFKFNPCIDIVIGIVVQVEKHFIRFPRIAQVQKTSLCV